MKKGAKKTVIEVSFVENPKPKLYTQEEVEELLAQQRQICADCAETKSETSYFDCNVGYVETTVVDTDSIIYAPQPNLEN